MQNRRKWFSNQSLKEFLKLLWYGRRDLIPGIDGHHIHIPYKKEAFFEVWDLEYDILHETCTHKIRTKQDVTPWCIRDWQLLSGTFCNKKPIGKYFPTAGLERNGAINYVKRQKGKVICLNDAEDETDFELHKQMIIEAFEQILPDKSAFEL